VPTDEGAAPARLELPDRPIALRDASVALWRQPVTIETYDPLPPSPHAMFLESRVYQGSSGRVYPLPFHERIAHRRRPRVWDAVHIENHYVRLMVLPELGGRIHVGLDRTTGYDFFYRQNVVKPALVGLAGPWISGGVEFNWPQHHRPGTFLPVDVFLEEDADGSATVWCSDHDPMARMKGMHGVRLRPDSSVVELRVRLHNRTDLPQTFLWWANVGVRVHDEYQAFFPTDVTAVADHAKRATTTYPRASGRYYGVDYPARVTADDPDADRLDWYRNIPVPTSYMCVDTREDFFGGYDHRAGAGLVHVADHRIAPGKKLWTWGDHPFGHAWQRNLTDDDGPYIELMAGVYTDNQPDFSFLAPGETKTFSQYWYPIAGTGPVHGASADVAVRLDVDSGAATLTVAATAPRPGTTVRLVDARHGTEVGSWDVDLAPGDAARRQVVTDAAATDLVVEIEHDGHSLLRWRRPEPSTEPIRPATAPPQPEQIASSDELHIAATHVRQYRHPTRAPEPYWLEALRRDPGDARSNIGMAAVCYERAEYETAARYAAAAVARLTARNPNPYDGEAHYRLGLALRELGRTAEAYDALYKATWNAAWRAPAYFALAQLDCRAGEWARAADHLDRCLDAERWHLRARDLRALVHRAAGDSAAAADVLAETRRVDPLDWWAVDIAGDRLGCDAQTCLDVAIDYADAGFATAALAVLDRAEAAAQREQFTGALPLVRYHRAAVLAAAGLPDEAAAARSAAAATDLAYCFPSRLADERVLRSALAADPADDAAAALLGCWYYDRRRHADAIALWRASAERGGASAAVWRNLGVAVFNVDGDAAEAERCYRAAIELDPDDGRLRYEQDQLAKRLGRPPADRLAALDERPDLVDERDDLTVEVAHALCAVGATERALALVSGRRFQPWEGGEGQALAVWERVHTLLWRQRLAAGDTAGAIDAMTAALEPPESLGEARHLLASTAHLRLRLGDALAAAGRADEAAAQWSAAAADVGDFQEMAVRPYSELTYFSVLALRRLGDDAGADQLAVAVEAYARELATSPAIVDYFATSLPELLLFRDDPTARQRRRADLLLAQMAAARGQRDDAIAALDKVRADDPNDPMAVDLLAAWTAGYDA
jgi:tetratricopeptide (TPR) repeat protein